MSNQERLDQLIRHIEELAKLTNDIRGTEIYPVTFFSRAFELTGKMQVDLHEIEMGQIELFDRQLREHREQLRSIERTTHPTLDRPTATHHAVEPSSTPVLTSAVPPTFDEEPVMRPASAPTPKPTPAPQPAPIPTPKPAPQPALTPKSEPQSAPTPQPAPISTSVPDATPEPTPAPKPAPVHKPLPHTETINDRKAEAAREQKTEASLNDAIERTKLTDLRKAFTLNDRFYFCRELFDRDEARMNEMLDILNEARTYRQSLELLRKRVRWDFESEAAVDFLKFIERRFV